MLDNPSELDLVTLEYTAKLNQITGKTMRYYVIKLNIDIDLLINIINTNTRYRMWVLSNEIL